MRIQLLLTGNEIMSGHTVDSNSAMVAELLQTRGYNIYRKVTIGDDLALLIDEIQSISANSDILIINGGLGPTVDDLTAQAVATATGQELHINQNAVNHVQDWCKKRAVSFNASGEKQAILPHNANIINNPIGSAVGFSCNFQGCLIICTPGVPSELRKMMQESILSIITTRFPNQQSPSTLRLQTFGLGESFVQELVNKRSSQWPNEVELGFRAGMPLLELKLSIQQQAHQQLQQDCYDWLMSEVSDYIIGHNNTTLASSVLALLERNGQRLCCAESCTGGLIASMLTERAGASAAFEAGIISYSNASKQKLLNVNANLLSTHGAVSDEVVRAMAEGALKASKADYGIAISGIAGPDGGSNDKPLGTVFIAWGQQGQLNSLRLCYPRPRQVFQKMMAAVALDLLRRELLGICTTPLFIKRYRYSSDS